jgi:hypothetical protein
MTRKIDKNLIQSIQKIPSGVVVTSALLAQNGVSSKLSWWYVHTNWLEKIGVNAYKKPDDEILWPGIVVALQQQLNLPLHVSDKYALLLLGKAHFIPQNDNRTIRLFTETKVVIPTWVYQKNLSTDSIKIVQNKLLSSYEAKDFIERDVNGLFVRVSSPELAMLETLHLIPKNQDFWEAAKLMEGLHYLRSSLVQSLLERCLSIKDKRLFLYLASKYNHPWVNELDILKMELGHGRRVIAGGGCYDPVYQISIPIFPEEY